MWKYYLVRIHVATLNLQTEQRKKNKKRKKITITCKGNSHKEPTITAYIFYLSSRTAVFFLATLYSSPLSCFTPQFSHFSSISMSFEYKLLGQVDKFSSLTALINKAPSKEISAPSWCHHQKCSGLLSVRIPLHPQLPHRDHEES